MTDELREAATCLNEASGKLRLAVDEANADEDERLAIIIGTLLTSLIVIVKYACPASALNMFDCSHSLLPQNLQ